MTKKTEWENSDESRKDRKDLEPSTNTSKNKLIEDGWENWKIYIIETIDKIETKVDVMDEKFRSSQFWCTEEIVRLKVKSSIWGAIAGFIASIIFSVIISVTINQLENENYNEFTKEQEIHLLHQRIDILQEELSRYKKQE